MISKMDRILLSGLVRARSWWRSEKGQGAFEYILILGGISAVIVVGLFVFAGPTGATILAKTCSKIKSISVFSAIDCPS